MKISNFFERQPRSGKTKRGTKFEITRPIATTFGPISTHDFSISQDALHDLIDLAASRHPEIGGLGFGPSDKLGVDSIELDGAGSARGTRTVYANDGEWGCIRQEFHMAATPCRIVQMMWHTHPGSFGSPSQKVGRARGDIGMFEAFFEGNEWAEVLLTPILTQEGDRIRLHPWVATRGKDGRVEVGLGNVKILNPSKMPKAVFNADWERSVDESTNRSEYVKRLSGIVSEKFRSKTILMVGTGGGSYQAEKLARYMPKKLILIDPDVVSISNLSRTNFTYEDAICSKPKVSALQERLKSINPFLEVEALPEKLEDLSLSVLRKLLREVDIIVEGSDSFQSKKFTNEVARLYKKKAVFIGVHAGAQSARIIAFDPGSTPCYECVANDRYQNTAVGVEADLPGQAGAVADLQLVDMTALKIILGMLESGEETSMGRFYTNMIVRGSEVIVRTTVESAFGSTWFDALLSDLPVEPKPYAKELSLYFLGIDATVISNRARPGCACCPTESALEVGNGYGRS